MNTKSLLATLALAASLLALLFACSKDEDPAPPEVTATAFSHTIDENPAASTSLGTFSATTSNGTLAYALSDEAPAGALAIDPASGELTVKNAALFDFEVNPSIKATGTATAEGVSQSADIVITLTDVKEGNTVGEVTVIAEDFSVTIDENPEAEQVLGTLKATTTEGTLSYALASQTPEGALSINAGSGELTVANAAEFDYETNETITARAVATAGAVSDTATVTITLKDVDESTAGGEVTVVAEDFSATIDENPEAGQVLGTLKASASKGTLSYALLTTGLVITDPGIGDGGVIALPTPDEALAVNDSTGELTVANPSKFDYETNKTIKAQVIVTAGAASDTATVTITLKDVDESVVAEDFSIIIDENPEVGQILGTVKATTNAGTLAYSIMSGQAGSAVAINETSGELTVADSTIFDYESSTTVEATYEVSNGTDTQQGSITIALNDVAEVEPGSVPFITTWTIPSNSQNLILPTAPNVGYNFTVDWGDGNTGKNEVWHNYSAPGTYTVKITGHFPAIRCYNSPQSDRNKLATIEQWGNIAWESFFDAFNGCRNLVYNATDAPDLSNVTSLRAAFANTIKFNGAIGNWDVSNIQNMEQMFYQATGFNQPLSNWDVSNVTNMKGMFSKASAFDQPLGAWNMRSIKNMDNTFDDAGLSHTNYGATLKGWSKQSDLPELIVVGAKGIKYCGEGTVYRNQLIDIKKWWFTNDAQDNNLCR